MTALQTILDWYRVKHGYNPTPMLSKQWVIA